MIKKINLIFFISNFSFGGAGNSIVKLCSQLSKKRYSISIICIGKSDYKKILQKHDIDVIEINKSKLLYSLFDLVRIINKLVKKDVKNILVSNIHYSNVIIILIRYFIKPLKIILVERTPIEELDIYFNLKDFLKKKILKFLVKYTYPFADLIICNSFGIKKGLYKLINKKIYVIYPPSITKVLKEKNFKTNNIKFFSFSRLSNEKNILLILKAINYLKNQNYNYFLNIYGNGNEESNLKLYVKQNNLKKNIKFKGFRKNINQLKDQIYICASLFEGCCNATIEALNNSKIILSSDCPGGNREIILNGRGGELFLNNNFKSLARSMKLIINNLPKQIKKAKMARKNLYRFKLQNNKLSYENIFHNI